MIVGVGRVPQRLLEELRALVDHPSVFIYPEFFDDKRSLLAKRHALYVERLLRYRGRVVIAVWPDYLYEDRYGLCRLDVVWVFPIHSLGEFGKVPSCVDVVALAPEKGDRDYTVAQFVERARELGYAMWWFGARRREIGIAASLGFWGLDVNTGSTGLSYREIRSPWFPAYFARFLKRVADGEMGSGVLTRWI